MTSDHRHSRRRALPESAVDRRYHPHSGVVRRLAQAYRNRNDASVLARLDDRMLADIGITRSDVRDALRRACVARPDGPPAGPRARATPRSARHLVRAPCGGLVCGATARPDRGRPVPGNGPARALHGLSLKS